MWRCLIHLVMSWKTGSEAPSRLEMICMFMYFLGYLRQAEGNLECFNKPSKALCLTNQCENAYEKVM